MAATTIKVSVSGDDKAALRASINAVLSAAGFRRRGAVEFVSHDGIGPNAASGLIARLYEQEATIVGTRLTTLLVDSTLVRVEMKKDKNRSI